jgi:hypothetical protein
VNTDELIATLSKDAAPLAANAGGRRLGLGVAAGAAASIALLANWLGLRPDLGAAIGDPAFLTKTAYGLSLAVVALALCRRLARPEGGRIAGLWLVIAPTTALAFVAAAELAGMEIAERREAWLGFTANDCPWRVLALAAPVYLGLAWAFRRFAPTRQTLTGAMAGLAAGGIGAAVYALYCTEPSASFILTWYSLGILVATTLGAAAGRLLFRW